ncbi:MAG: hypothetical protein AB7O67_15320 [Vicinamibacterales bacterium]
MKPNIFLVDPVLCPEDRLTAYWHYVLSVVPGLGQAFADAISETAGLQPSPFLGAIDHPYGDSQNRPDLLIQCRDWSVLFEHKLDSPVGPRQLQRYGALAASRGWKFALLSAWRLELPDEVLRSPSYVSPSATGGPPHFMWQDLPPLLGAVDHHLAREFAEFLEWAGLGKFSWAGLGDPFIDTAAARALLDLYDSIGKSFRRPGVQCRKSASSLIYQIRTPFAPVHLINVGPLQSVAQESPTVRGPVMGVWVWISRPGAGDRRVLSVEDAEIKLGPTSVTVKNHLDGRRLPYAKPVYNERSYYVPLDYVLQASTRSSAQRLAQFVEAVAGHLKEEVATAVPGIPSHRSATRPVASRRG